MSNAAQKRMAELHNDNRLCHPKEALSYRDLLIILTHDDYVRHILNEIVQQEQPCTMSSLKSALNKEQHGDETAASAPETCKTENVDLEQRESNTVSLVPNPLLEEIASAIEFLELVETELELCGRWIVESETKGKKLMQLIANASQWDEICQLWDRIALRCKEKKRPADEKEVEILSHSINIHNMIYRDRRAGLIIEKTGIPFDHEKHQRGNEQGRNISELWLPGLHNASGEIQKKPLIATTR